MKIPINEFELHFEETILKRGLAYFKKGAVSEVIETDRGIFEASVMGTDCYTVHITIKNELITKATCNCLYDQGILCKHIAAVIFYLQKDTLGIEPSSAKRKTEKSPLKKPSKKKSLPEQVAAIAEHIEKEELVKFVISHSENNKSFAQFFIDHFADKNEFESIQYYAKQIRIIITSMTSKNKYHPWKNANVIGQLMTQKYQVANAHLEKGNDQTGTYMCLAIIEELIRSLAFLDDSNGMISSVIELSLDAFIKLRDKKISEKLKAEIFEYCVSNFIKRKFAGWDWHINLLKIAADFKSGDKDVQKLLQIIDREPYADYLIEELQIIRFKLLFHSGRVSEANAYIDANLNNRSFRIDAIKMAIDEKKFDRAIKLAEQGIEQDKDDKPGNIVTWRQFLLEISMTQKQTDKILQYARLLFFDRFGRREYYYDILKKHTPNNNWPAFVESLLIETNKLNSWDVKTIRGSIFIWEKRWKDLLDLITINPHFSELDNYETVLLQYYPTEWKELYGKAILEFARTAQARSAYKQVAQHLIKLHKKGGEEITQKIVEDLRILYKHRPSMMDELRNI